MEKANYQTEILNSNLYKIFGGVYNDFRSVAKSDYMFKAGKSLKDLVKNA